MTVGSWSTVRTTYESTGCSQTSSILNGTRVSWIGQDSATRKSEKSTFKVRKAQFLKDPTYLPNGRPKLKPIDPNLASKGVSGTVFDRAREVRMKQFDGPPSEGDYRQPHPYEKYWTTYQGTSFPIYSGDGTYIGTCAQGAGGYGYDGFMGSPWTPDHDYKLVERLRNKVMGSSFNLGSFLGAEGADTIRFLTDTANRIYRCGVYAKKLDFRNAHRVLSEWGRHRNVTYIAGKRRREQEDLYRDLLEAAAARQRGQGWWSVPASIWLELHLAMEPLVGDMKAAAEQLAHITLMPRSQKVTASVRTSADAASVVSGPLWVGNRTVKKKLIAYFTHQPEPSNFLGLQDPEVTLWNALPLTFVGDYAYNIGGYLEANATMKAMPPGVFITSTKDEVNLSALIGRKYNGNMSTVVGTSYQQSQKYRNGSFTRTVGASYAVPAPRFIPYGAAANWQRMTTVLSLVATLSDRNADTLTRWMR